MLTPGRCGNDPRQPGPTGSRVVTPPYGGGFVMTK